jgi:hypothetical protein
MGGCFLWAVFENYRSTSYVYTYIFFKKWIGLYCGRFFLQTRLVTLVETPFVLMQFYVL